MNLPQSVDDSSLLQCEPLRTCIATYESMDSESRSNTRSDLISKFVVQMQQKENAQATAAVKIWARFLFRDIISEDSLLEPMDGGETLYTCFFKYQLKLSKGLRCGNTHDVHRYQASVLKKGLIALKLKDNGAHAQRSIQGEDEGGSIRPQGNQRSHRPGVTYSPAKVSRQADSSVGLPDKEIEISSSLACQSRSTMGNSGTQQELPCDTHSATGTPLSISPEPVKPSKHSTSKKKQKRRASSQKPPVITPSDASEDDKGLKESSNPRTIAVANSVSHRSKRVAASPRSPPIGSLRSQVDKKNSPCTPRPNNRRQEGARIFGSESPLTSLESDVDITPPSRDKCGAEVSLSDQKHDEERISNVSTTLSRETSNPGKLRKMKTGRDQQIRAYKRLRRASMSTPGSEPGEGSKSTHDIQVKDPKESTIQGSTVIGPSLARGDIIVAPKARRKRTQLESGTGFIEIASNSSREPLGPNPRPFRPLPRKVCSGRLPPGVDDDTTAREATRGAPSLDHSVQLIRDAASDALVTAQDGAGWDLEDWTQDEEHDVEFSYLGGHDDDEENDVQVVASTSAPPATTPKPPVPVPPRIWAQSRQEVCESLEYFRSYHSGVYSKDDIVKGYLLGAHAASRDVFHHNGKLIISHGGGKSESILGPKRYQTDQDQEASDKSVRALLKTHKDRRPVVLLADDKYALFPYDLTSANYTYVVLGLYWISHAWAERQAARGGLGHIVRWKFAFQWCEGQGDPWWPPREMTNTTSDPLKPVSILRTRPANTGGEPNTRCKSCHEHSPFVYKQGWMCLNPHCNVFWSINGEDPDQLDCREEFLALLPLNFEKLPDIVPTRAVETGGGVTTTYACSKGWHCPKCGRLSCRYKWEHWECASCHLKQEVNGRIRSPKEFWHQRPAKGSFLHSQVAKESGILACRSEPVNLGGHKVTNRLTFILPHNRGKIHVVLGTPWTNGDANDIFKLYQQQASTGELKLRRYPLHNHRARGLLLTNYFSQNSGEPYQYVGGSGNTVPFHEAPDCVQRALALIKERAGLALGTDTPFNEILTAAYMERQKMSFHSDSEKELGPIVASLSMGSAALMHFRSHVNVGDPKCKGYALTLVLRHGDVLIMEGDGVQKYYEHTVIPMNFRIAATARCIGTN